MNLQEKPVGVLVELPLGDSAINFKLEKAVCSHGLFMMAPNHWDPQSKTLQRPLRLDDDGETSYMVHISQPHHSPQLLCLNVFGTDSISPQRQQSLLAQVRRMLRLSDEENMMVKEFHEVHEKAKETGFGRVFRSPTLFEDMVKCILLCNCQWSRTLSMAQALCELQFELQHHVLTGENLNDQTNNLKQFMPNTPAGKESRKKIRSGKCSRNLIEECEEASPVQETEMKVSSVGISLSDANEQFVQKSESLQTTYDVHITESSYVQNLQPSIQAEGYPCITKIGNFPSPKELATLNDKFLAKRCNLGYRACRIVNFARDVFEGRIELSEFDSSDASSLSGYDELAEKLKAIYGFGPFTCANVLMCMGFYHVIPTDSETIRHLKQVHGKISTIKTVRGDVESIYGKYAPFQFLAYWTEVWHFYEEWFGKASEMTHSQYKLITAANMRPNKKTKLIK